MYMVKRSSYQCKTKCTHWCGFVECVASLFMHFRCIALVDSTLSAADRAGTDVLPSCRQRRAVWRPSVQSAGNTGGCANKQIGHRLLLCAQYRRQASVPSGRLEPREVLQQDHQQPVRLSDVQMPATPSVYKPELNRLSWAFNHTYHVLYV